MSWTWSDITPGTASGSKAIRDIVFADATHCVAVGDTGLVYVSSDAGASFSAVTPPENNNWRGLAYAPPASGLGTGNGRYCAVSSGGVNRTMYSDDFGATWTAVASATVAGWQSIDYDAAHTRFLAVASSSGGGIDRVMTGSGAAWTARTASAVKSWSFVRVAGSIAVAAHVSGGTDSVMTSSDGGVTWATQTTPNWTSVGGPASGSSGIIWGTTQALFAMPVRRSSDSKYRIATSPDGATWTERAIVDDTNRPLGIVSVEAAALGAFVDQAGTNRFNTSADFVTWADEATGINKFWDCAGWGEAALVFLSWNQNTNGTFLRGVWTFPPTADSLDPAVGDAAGGTVVRITGTNFSGSYSVTFGGTAAVSVIVESATSIVCVTPPHAVGVVDVVVVGVGTLSSAFSFTAVTRVSPKAGTVAGGTPVTVTGFGFAAVTAVNFDGVAATNVVVVSNTSLTCVTPAHASGLVDVEVVDVGTGTHLYTYTLPIPQNLGKGPLLPPLNFIIKKNQTHD